MSEKPITAAEAVLLLDADIRDRSGIKHEWRKIDADVMHEIHAAWTEIIERTALTAELEAARAEVAAEKRTVRDLVLTLIEARDGLEYVGKQDAYINYERARIIKDHVAEAIEEHACPTCKGHGFIPAWVPTYSDPDNSAGAPDTAECPDCTP